MCALNFLPTLSLNTRQIHESKASLRKGRETRLQGLVWAREDKRRRFSASCPRGMARGYGKLDMLEHFGQKKLTVGVVSHYLPWPHR